jgi:transposase
MSNLPDRSRAVLALRELEGLSYREVAALMGIPLGTVMSGLWRARRAFRAALDEELKPSGAREWTRSLTPAGSRGARRYPAGRRMRRQESNVAA